ncbi:MAG TPA: hypothetical protein VFW87_14955 [Pirellulales bacterium]|nr:hypothetical protein [Pirellulales bacterium]
MNAILSLVCEIFLLVYWCKKMGALLSDKGYRAGGYQTCLVLAWFGGEFFGALFAAIVLAIVNPQAHPNRLLLYLASLVGAILGVSIVFKVARTRPDLRAGLQLEWDAGGASGSDLPHPLPQVSETGNPYQAPSYPERR